MPSLSPNLPLSFAPGPSPSPSAATAPFDKEMDGVSVVVECMLSVGYRMVKCWEMSEETVVDVLHDVWCVGGEGERFAFYSLFWPL